MTNIRKNIYKDDFSSDESYDLLIKKKNKKQLEKDEIKKFKTSHKKPKYDDEDDHLFIDKNHNDSDDLDYFEREYASKNKNKTTYKKNYLTKNNSGDFVYNKIIK